MGWSEFQWWPSASIINFTQRKDDTSAHDVTWQMICGTLSNWPHPSTHSMVEDKEHYLFENLQFVNKVFHWRKKLFCCFVHNKGKVYNIWRLFKRNGIIKLHKPTSAFQWTTWACQHKQAFTVHPHLCCCCFFRLNTDCTVSELDLLCTASSKIHHLMVTKTNVLCLSFVFLN